jgi:hypothetical protein
MRTRFLVTTFLPVLILAVSTGQARAAATYEQAEGFFAKLQFEQARSAYLDFAQNNADSTLSLPARLKAATCLFNLQREDEFKREAEALLKVDTALEAVVRELIRAADAPAGTTS